MQKTPIEWTDYSSNSFKARHKPVDKWPCPKCGMRGTRLNHNLCVKISPGCANCYAATLTHRWGGPDYLARAQECFEPVLDEKELNRILRVKVKPGENKVFPFDMTDMFWEFWPDEFLDKFFAVVALRPDLIFQVLTKRAERMHDYFTGKGYQARHYQVEALRMDGPEARRSDIRCEIVALGGRDGYNRIEGLKWPLPNVWLGISAEDQTRFDERWPFLRDTPAAVRWISYEPAIAGIDFRDALPAHMGSRSDHFAEGTNGPAINWIVVGGESGPGARPFDVQWARDTIAQCRAAGVPVFCKQLGSRPRTDGFISGPEQEWSPGKVSLVATTAPGGDAWREIHLKDKKGGNIEEWPEDIRVREFPQ